MLRVNHNLKRILMGTVFVTACTYSSALSAQEKAVDLSVTAGVTTDYRFRGVSLSDKDFAVFGSLGVSHDSGFYASAWASSIQEFQGSDVEVDFTVGYGSSIGELSTNIGVIAYTYPGSDNTAYFEVYGSVGGSVEQLSWTLGTNYAFKQDNIGGNDNIYVYLSGSVPLAETGLSLTGTVGYEDGAFGDGKWDWAAGLSYGFGKFSASVNYIDANLDSGAADAGVVASLSVAF